MTWLNGQRRNPLPAKVTVVREASHFQAFGWVRLDVTDPIAAFSDDLVDKRDQSIMILPDRVLGSEVTISISEGTAIFPSSC